MIVIDDVGVFPLMKGDLVGGQTIDGVVAALRVAVSEGREARSLTAMLKASGFALLGTACSHSSSGDWCGCGAGCAPCWSRSATGTASAWRSAARR